MKKNDSSGMEIINHISNNLLRILPEFPVHGRYIPENHVHIQSAQSFQRPFVISAERWTKQQRISSCYFMQLSAAHFQLSFLERRGHRIEIHMSMGMRSKQMTFIQQSFPGSVTEQSTGIPEKSGWNPPAFQHIQNRHGIFPRPVIEREKNLFFFCFELGKTVRGWKVELNFTSSYSGSQRMFSHILFPPSSFSKRSHFSTAVLAE